MEEQTQTVKVPFYKRKAVAIPLVLVFAMVLVSATVAYFHSVDVDLTFTEARSSADLLVDLALKSGETNSTVLTISNAANVPLCAELSWNETEATNATYTNNLPLIVTLEPLADTNTTVNFTASQITEAGTVKGKIHYNKVACAV